MLGITLLRNNLSICYAAIHNALERYPPPECHPDILKAVLADISAWVETPLAGDAKKILWMHGRAGIGKSAIAQIIMEERVQNNMPVASFFFSRGHLGRGTAAQFWQTLAFQIAMSIPKLQSRMGRATVNNPTLFLQSPYDQLRRLLQVIDPFYLSLRLRGRSTMLTEDMLISSAVNFQPQSRRTPMSCLRCRGRKIKVLKYIPGSC